MRSTRSIVVLSAVVALAVTGCSRDDGEVDPTAAASATTVAPEPSEPEEPTPTPTPTPTQSVDPHPELEEIVVSTSGLGPLTVGLPPDDNPGAEMLEWDADACAEIVAEGDDAGLWVASGYEAGTNYEGRPFDPPFFVDASDDAVNRIDLMASEPATAEGIRIGSTVDELRAAYPDLEGPFEGPVSKVWWMTDDAGSLVFETQGADGGLRPAGTEESIILIRVLASEWAPDFATANSGDIAGACPF